MAKAVLEVDVQTKEALRDVQKFSKSAAKSISNLSDSFKLLGVAAAGAVAAFAGRQIVQGINSVIDAASRQEDAINSLNTALKVSGEFSREASEDIQSYASAIQQTSKFGDEAVLEQVALAKSFGATNEQAKLATTAAVEYASATGKSLEEATRQAAKTLGGFAGELGEINPAIKELTSEQLKAGGALRVLIDQFGGSSTGKLKTFSGATSQLSNTFGDLLEEVGFLITKNPQVISGINEAQAVFKDLIKELQSDAVKDFASDIISATKDVAELGKEIAKIAGPIIRSIVDGFAKIARAANNFLNPGELQKVTKQFKGIRTELREIQKNIRARKAETGLVDVNELIRERELLEEITKLQPKFKALGFEITKALGIKKLIEEANNPPNIEVDLDIKTDKQKLAEEAKEAARIFKEAIEAEATGPFIDPDLLAGRRAGAIEGESGFVGPSIGEDDLTIRRLEQNDSAEFNKQLVAGAGRAASALAGGAEGARKALVDGAALAGDAFLPGLGQAAKPLIDLLSKGPEETQKQLQAFVDELPKVLENFADAIPVIVKTLAENTDEIIIALVKGIPSITKALVIEVPKALADPDLWKEVAGSLIDAVVEGFQDIGPDIGAVFIGAAQLFTQGLANAAVAVGEFFRVGLSDALKQIVPLITGSFQKGATTFVQKITGPFTSIFKSLTDGLLSGLKATFASLPRIIGDAIKSAIPSGGVGGIGGGGLAGTFIRGGAAVATGGLSEALLADGGTIPPGFPNDTFSAGLTSGEEVVSVSDRSEILGKQDSIISQLSQLNEMMARPQVATATAEVDGAALADIILELNRNNQRLA